MCGRYSLDFDDRFYTRYNLINKHQIKSSYNIAPAQIMPVIVSNSQNSVELMLWGLIPFWEEKNSKPKGLINIRDDTIIAKTWPKKYIETQRCLVPATGFFEWKRKSDGKQPFYFYIRNKKYFSFAGLYSKYVDKKQGREIKTYVIITTTPNSVMETVHNRMPALLKEEDEQLWLNPDKTEIDYLKNLFKPYPSDLMEKYPVSSYINNPTHNDRLVLQPQFVNGVKKSASIKEV